MSNLRTCAIWLAAVVGAWGAPHPVAAQTTVCTEIVSLPHTITSSGVYCLKQSFYTDIGAGAAITIAASSVVLDLGGFTVNNLAGGTAAWSTGISATNKGNVTIRNGRLSWFRTGISLTSSAGSQSRGHVVENVDVQFPQHTGIRVDGRGIKVEDCNIRRLFGIDGYGVGIVVEGDGNVVEGNVISDFTATNGRGLEVYGNDHLIVDNRITNPNNYGLLVNSLTTKYRDNLVTGASTAYAGGIDVGNNQ